MIVNVRPWWKTALVTLIVELSQVLIGSVIMLVRSVGRKK